MSNQPWMVFGATIYQLNEAENENVWSAHVQGARLPLDDACTIAKKMHAADDMQAALKECIHALQVGLDAAQIISTLGDGRCAAIRSAMDQASAALAKAAP